MPEVIHRYIGKGQKVPRIRPPVISAEEKQRVAEMQARDVRAAEERIVKTATQRMQGQLVLAKARNEVIPKPMVQAQAAFLVVALRQKIMQLPQSYHRRILGLTDPNKARAILREAALGLLAELQDLPSKVTDPDFMRTLDEDQKNGEH